MSLKVKLAELLETMKAMDADEEIREVEQLIDVVKNAEIEKVAFIRRRGNKWCVLSHKGKSLGCYKTKHEAQKRLRSIEYWKTHK